MQIKVKRLSGNSRLPEYAHKDRDDISEGSRLLLPTDGYGDLAADLYAAEGAILLPGERRLIGTGLAFEFPRFVGALVHGRSGLFAKQGLFVNIGVVDPGYRGELKVMMMNMDKETRYVAEGERIAQLRLVMSHQMEFVSADEINETPRNEKGFGSTGPA
jgi:dUTP pyrophosphatase